MMRLTKSLLKGSFLRRAKPRNVVYSHNGNEDKPVRNPKREEIISNWTNLSGKTWMRDLIPRLKDWPLIHLSIPGSHSSTFYPGVYFSPDPSPDNEAGVLYLMNRYKSDELHLIPYLYNWCVTQEYDISKQLELGVRYFDFHVAARSDDNPYVYLCHGVYGCEVFQPLMAIEKFLEENQEEVVILDFHGFHNFTKKHFETLIKNRIKTSRFKLCEVPSNIREVSLNWMLKHGYRAIVIFRYTRDFRDQGLWPSNLWGSPQFKTPSIENLHSFIVHAQPKRRMSKGHVTHAIIVPDKYMVMENPDSSLKEKCAIELYHSKTIIPWLMNQVPGPAGINVVSADFVNYGDFVKIIISINYMIEE